ncbi:MAG: hypothetical protein WCB71_04925 [Aestuariivirga sp.]
MAANKIFSVRFKHVERETILAATLLAPTTVRHFSKLTNAWHEHLESKVKISFDRKRSTQIVGGGSWLEIIFLATELIRRHIPENEEKEWVNESGTASWAILPKTIPIGWGYELHRKLSDHVNNQVEKYIAQVDKKRRTYEMRKKKPQNES